MATASGHRGITYNFLLAWTCSTLWNQILHLQTLLLPPVVNKFLLILTLSLLFLFLFLFFLFSCSNSYSYSYLLILLPLPLSLPLLLLFLLLLPLLLPLPYYYYIIVTITGRSHPSHQNPTMLCAAQTQNIHDPYPRAFPVEVPGKSRQGRAAGAGGSRAARAHGQTPCCRLALPRIWHVATGDWHWGPADGGWGQGRGRLVVQPQPGSGEAAGPRGQEKSQRTQPSG